MAKNKAGPLLGCHLSIAGGLDKAIEAADALGINALQIFSHSARSWRMASLAPDAARAFIERRRASDVRYTVIHTIYLINLASPKDEIYRLSIEALRQELQRAAELRIHHVNTHVGAHMGQGVEQGLQRVVAALERVMKSPKGRQTAGVKVLLENSAGEGTELGVEFAELGYILDNVSVPERFGVCLDTCHAFAAGYALQQPSGLEATLREFERAVGFERLELIHVNDSKFPCNSRRDRHEHIGKGRIGLAGFAQVVNHPKLAHLPFILETPKDDETSDATNLDRVRSLISRRQGGP